MAFGEHWKVVLLNDPCPWCAVLRRRNKPSKRPTMTIDHVRPSATGGSNHWHNLVGCCEFHNTAKSSRSVLEMLVGVNFRASAVKGLRKQDRERWVERRRLREAQERAIYREEFEQGRKLADTVRPPDRLWRLRCFGLMQ